MCVFWGQQHHQLGCQLVGEMLGGVVALAGVCGRYCGLLRGVFAAISLLVVFFMFMLPRFFVLLVLAFMFCYI